MKILLVRKGLVVTKILLDDDEDEWMRKKRGSREDWKVERWKRWMSEVLENGRMDSLTMMMKTTRLLLLSWRT